jgi:hypothetical protein
MRYTWVHPNREDELMRTTTKAMGLAAVALCFVLTACNGNGVTVGSGSSSSPGAPGGSSGATGEAASPGASTGDNSSSTGGNGTGNAKGHAASCLVGNWKSTSAVGTIQADGVNGSISGGGGVLLTIGRDGKTTINFDGMTPESFTATLAGNQVNGNFGYGGQLNGTVQTGDGDAGSFAPVGTTDFKTLTVSVKITAPTQMTIADKVPLAQYAGTDQASTGNAVDAQPILRRGTFTCSGGELRLGAAEATAGQLIWKFTKA